jgi:hypothetical protein
VPSPYPFLTVNRVDRPAPEVVRDVVHQGSDLVRLEWELARQELKELAIRNGIAVGLLVLGGLLVMVAVLVALPVFLVVLWDRHVLGAAIWIGVYVVLGAALVLAGRLGLRLEPPRRTLASLEETKNWVLRQIRSSSR